MKLSEIYLNPDNPRNITANALSKLAESIKTFPQMLKYRPIIIDDDNVIIAGNQRFKALKKLGYEEVDDNWVKRASDLTPEQVRRFIVQDNIQAGEWDVEALKSDWNVEELTDWGITELTPISSSIDLSSSQPAEEDEEEIECPECGHRWLL